MSKHDKTLARVLAGSSDGNIAFGDLCSLLRAMGFDERIRGSHHIYTRDGIAEIINLQPKGAKAKAYQVRQVRELLLDNRLAGDEDAAEEDGE